MRVLHPHDPAPTYAAVFDALPVIAYLANPDGAVTYLSHGWERLTGHPCALVLEHGYDALVHPEDLGRSSARWAAARTGGTPFRGEMRLRLADGSYRWMVNTAEPMREADGAVTGWFGTLTDIADLRATEEALVRALDAAAVSALDAAERAAFVERLIDASDDCVKVLETDGRLVSMSPNGQRALGIADFSAVAGADWTQFWNGDDRVAAHAAVAAARAGGRGRFTGLYAVAGRERWWDVTITPIRDGDGRVEHLLAVSRDVTEHVAALHTLTRSEERYRLVAEAMPGVVWTAGPDGRLDHIAGSASANRAPLAERLGDAWLNTVHAEERETARRRWATALATGEPYETQFRVRTADGAYRWQLVRALPQRDEAGTIVRWVGVNIDIDDQRRASDAREQFVRLAEASDDFVGIADLDGTVAFLNAAGRRMVGLAADTDIRTTRFMDYLLPEGRTFAEREVLPAMQRDGRWLGEYQFRNFTTDAGVPVWWNALMLYDEHGHPTGMGTVTRDLRERQRIETGLRTLAETGSAMFRSLDYEETMRNVAEAVTRGFATYCIVDVLGADGNIVHVVNVHRDPALTRVLTRAAETRQMAKHPVSRAIRDGSTTLEPVVDVSRWREQELMRAERDDLERLAPLSFICVPVRSGNDGSVIGALSFGVDQRDPRGAYTPDDLRFAEEIALRAGLAFDHARAYQRERRIAETLQKASLPAALPAVPGVRLSADYRPGNSEATIGGDWYDAFTLEDGRLVITIGDVVGKGLHAAVTMGKVRQAMQAVAMVIADANTMLDAADRTIRAEGEDTYATALAGIYDHADGTFRFASAGHPGPLLRRPDGTIEDLTAPGMLLGLRARNERRTQHVIVPPGSSLVFFTDGLVETTRQIDEGHSRLRVALADPTVMAAPSPAAELVTRVLRGEPATDDVAVLVAQAATA